MRERQTIVKKHKKGKVQIPKTVQQTLPYIEAYENGVMQITPGVFSKTYNFEDISFKTSSDEEQSSIYEHYMTFLNTIKAKEDVTFTFVNSIGDSKEKLEKIVPIMRGDRLDTYRKEMAEILKDKITSARNCIETKKYITVRTIADTVDKAMQQIFTVGAELDTNFKKVTKRPLKELRLADRLELLNGIFNSAEKNYWFEHDAKGNVSVDFAKMAKQGLTTKDIIAPSALKFEDSCFKIGDRYGQVMYVDHIANWMSSNFLANLSSVNFESVISLHIQAIDQEEAIKKVHNQSVNITGEIMDKQNKLINKGNNPEFISVDLKNAKAQIDALQEDMMNRDQRLFYMSIILVHFAESREELKEQNRIIKSIGNNYMSTIRTLILQQERGFASVLPMGINKTYISKLLTTESLGVFLPFDEVNRFDPGGFSYGINPVNKSLIIHNRLKGQNYNGLVFGASGSGKSFSSKKEMTSAILNTDADVYIIDPDGEYSPIAESFGGSIITIAPGNGVYINPCDLDIDTSFDAEYNPIAMKVDFISGMLETMLGGFPLTPIQKSIVDRCVREMYRPYIEHLNSMPPDANGKRKTIDRDHCPTLQNLFDLLLSMPQPEAQNLALVMETYTTGSFDTFAHRTNVDLDSRLIVYNIKNIGTNLKELALKVCTNDTWTKMMENRRKNKWTWFYIDEFHLLLANNSTSEFLKTVWKRARKWNGVPTGITQDVEDLLLSPAARTIINNSSFVYMLNQSTMGRNMLQEILKLSDNDMEYVTNADAGHGLIYTGKQAIPFADDFPVTSELYKIFNTKSDDAA